MRGHPGIGFFGSMPPHHFGAHFDADCDPFQHHGPFEHRGHDHHHHGPHHHGPHHHGPHHYEHFGHGSFGHGPFWHGPVGHGPFGQGPSGPGFGPGHYKYFSHCRPRPYDRPEKSHSTPTCCRKDEGPDGEGRHSPPPCCRKDNKGCQKCKNRRKGRSPSPCCIDDSEGERRRSRSRGRKPKHCCPGNRRLYLEAEDSSNEATNNPGRKCGYGVPRSCRSV